jgi:MFS transporter, ACS family, hexuronate transporter
VTNRWAILALIMAAQTMANVGPLGIPSVAPLIREDLGLSMAQAGSFISAYYIGPSLISLPAGWMADRWGVRTSMAGGQAIIAIGLVAVAGSHAFTPLVILMIIAGAGYGILNPTTTKAGISWFPRRQRGTVTGLKQVGLPLGGALGALLMPPLALRVGWRAAVALAASIVVLLAVVTWLLYREPPEPEQGAGSPQPVALRRVLASRDLWMGFLVLYLAEVVRVPLIAASRFLVMAQVTGAFGRIAFGVLSDRVFGSRRRIVLMIAGLGSAACSVAMAGTGPGTSWWLLAALALAFGFVGIGWNGVQHTLLAEIVGIRAAGTAVGLGLAISSFGVTLCPPLFGLAVERLGGFAIPWVGLGLAMVATLCLLIPVREGRMETP